MLSHGFSRLQLAAKVFVNRKEDTAGSSPLGRLKSIALKSRNEVKVSPISSQLYPLLGKK